MKNVCILILILVSCSFSQESLIRYAADYEKFEMAIDSANTNLSYIYHDVYFSKKLHVEMTDSTAAAQFRNTGTHCIMVKPGLSRRSKCTTGDTDSLHIYVKELNPDSVVIANDSTIVTTADTGTDFDLNKVYLFDFTLSKAGAGYRIYARRQDDVGAIKLEIWAKK